MKLKHNDYYHKTQVKIALGGFSFIVLELGPLTHEKNAELLTIWYKTIGIKKILKKTILETNFLNNHRWFIM